MIFQFTTSQGGRPLSGCIVQAQDLLSIHDLTRRSTGRSEGRPFCVYLSIHDLTRRSTVYSIVYTMRNIFQFTTSQGGRQQTFTIFFYIRIDYLFLYTNHSPFLIFLIENFIPLHLLSLIFPVRISRHFLSTPHSH